MARIFFSPERETKGTWRFAECAEHGKALGSLDEPQIGTLYVKKRTLRDLGWESGEMLSVDLARAGLPNTKRA